MFFNKQALRWKFFTVVVMFCPIATVMAEEIGTTPDGNVKYRFLCPGRIDPKDVDIKIDWPNHVSAHPEWDVESGHGTGHHGTTSGDVTAKWSQKSRNGQVLKCHYRIELFGRPRGSFYYRYNVKRDIISCIPINRGWECILKD